MSFRSFIFAIGLACVGSAALTLLLSALYASSAPVCPGRTGVAEVTDLIQRLRPYARAADDIGYLNGIGIRFTGADVTVEVRPKHPPGGKYEVRAATLSAAVAQFHTLLEAQGELRKSLIEWGAAAPVTGRQ